MSRGGAGKRRRAQDARAALPTSAVYMRAVCASARRGAIMKKRLIVGTPRRVMR
jgi:hypothetical protein